MSEHYDFHYQPTGSGAISGQQVLQQTEDAINELGDYVNDNVGGAMDVAQQALETAQNAETNAQTALDTANSFSSAIQSAQQDASTALSTAQTAQTTASNANNTATQAQQDASSAVTTANNASGQVSTLSGTVTTLGQRVTTAEGNIGQNTSDITALTTRVGTAEGNITTLQNDVSIAQGNASSAMATAGQVKQQAFVFRYSSTALVASSTNSNSLLDNTDNLKVGDKVIDSNGVLFSITAIDTVNSTFTIGTALVDLAQDSAVVHKSGDETISGVKTITDTNLEFKSTSAEYGVSAGDSSVIFRDKNNLQTFKIYSKVFYAGVDNNLVNFYLTQKVDNTYYTSNGIQLFANTGDKNAMLRPILANNNADGLSISLGDSNRRWQSVYAMNYYYGSNNVEFSTKFVTTDTNQTISGNKTFSSDLSISNTDTTANTPSLRFRNYKIARGSTVEIGGQILAFLDKSGLSLVSVESRVLADGGTALRLYSYNKDSGNQTISSSIDLRKYSDGSVYLIPDLDNNIWLGDTLKKWKGIFTNQINNLEPSSLSLPSDRSARIDISSYITNLGNGDNNQYIVPANGYIWLHFTSINGAICYSQTPGGLTNYSQTFVRYSGDGVLYAFFPVRKDDKFVVQIYTSSTAVVQSAFFIPCQGNV